jgi:hypothetical protein
MTPGELRAEIESGPLAAESAANSAAGNDVATAAAMNDRTRGETLPRPMRLTLFTQFLMSRSLLRKIRDSEASDALPATIRDVCYGLLLLLQSGADREVDPTDPPTVAMIDALVAAGVATTSDKAAWLTACRVPASRAEVLWGYGSSVTAEQVGLALLPTRS